MIPDPSFPHKYVSAEIPESFSPYMPKIPESFLYYMPKIPEFTSL